MASDLGGPDLPAGGERDHAAALRPVLLWGPPGVGKSTVASRVAASMGRDAVDLDAELERSLGASIPEIFATRGEPAFREAERAAVRAVLEREDGPIVALGGGALVDPAVRDEALERGVVVTLTARLDVLVARLAGVRNRPLLGVEDDARAARMSRLLSDRRSAYEVGAARLEVSDALLDDVVARVLAAAQDRFVRVSDPSFVRFSRDGLAAARDLVRALDASRVLVVTDETVRALYGDRIVNTLDQTTDALIAVPPGEGTKRLARVEELADAFAARGADRRSVVVAIGGGVVTDLAGFAASVFMRGLRWIAIPTTTLGMVDAAIGGKTAVDLGARKNLVGSFHMPLSTIVDVGFARTESARARASGFAEALKSLAIGDRAGFEEFERAPRGDEDAWRRAIERGAIVKARVVREDPMEHGVRATLNFGHTLGHALEAHGGLERWMHGEAVALGMVAAVRLGVALRVTPPSVADRLVRALGRVGLPTALARSDVEGAAPFLRADKKRDRDAVRFVLLEELGRCTARRLSFDELERLLPQVCG
ncbi:MAG: 3-dehydroquinate synthase [Polyangiaceae bacterium]